MEEKILKTIKKYNLISNGDKIVVAVSGGPDSMCLLNILKNLRQKFNIELFVAHINHMIREEADSETEYVKNYCEKNNIKCFIKRANVLEMAKEQKKGTEEMGRIVRYDFFEYVANEVSANKIAIAHTENDNAETILMNLMRGASLEGLKGIEPIRGKYIRPLIECNREEIEKYCEINKLDPKFDKTNNDNTYTRNKIRNLLIPYIKKEFNPNIIETLNRLAVLARQDATYFNKIVKESYADILLYENINNNDINNVNENLEKYIVKEEKITRNIEQKLNNSKILTDKIEVTKLDNIKAEEKVEKNNINIEIEKKSKHIILDLKKFNKLEYVIKSRVLLDSINKLLGTTKGIEKINIEDMIKLCEKNIGNKYLIPNKNVKIFVKKGKIFFTKL